MYHFIKSFFPQLCQLWTTTTLLFTVDIKSFNRAKIKCICIFNWNCGKLHNWPLKSYSQAGFDLLPFINSNSTTMYTAMYSVRSTLTHSALGSPCFVLIKINAFKNEENSLVASKTSFRLYLLIFNEIQMKLLPSICNFALSHFVMLYQWKKIVGYEND